MLGAVHRRPNLAGLFGVTFIVLLGAIGGSPAWVAHPGLGTAPVLRHASLVFGTGATSKQPIGTAVPAPPAARGSAAEAGNAARAGVVAGVHPASMIDPLRGYTHEPAPMGIADYGVTGLGSGAKAYEYATSTLESHAVIRSISVAIPSHAPVTAFELNAVLVLQRGGVNYSYWIQNGLHIDSSTDEYTIGGAYVWNFSIVGATLASGELRGNSSSSLASDRYYFIPGCGVFPGQCTIVSLPGTLSGRLVTASSSGVPFVAYQYDIGAGWVTYDNVSFPRMSGATDRGFVVDGYAPTPYSANEFYDAEWAWGGAGGGSSSVDHLSDIAMSLSFWNGHNLQAIPNAWDFGGNTGETSANVSVKPEFAAADGAPSARMTNGTGTLGPLYNETSVGTLLVSVPVTSPETLEVNGIPTRFEGGQANLTLAAGNYSVSLRNYSNATTSITVVAGAASELNFSGAGRVAFVETGLPTGTNWSVGLNGSSVLSSGQAIVFHVANGTYTVTYAPISGFFLGGSEPLNLTVPSAAGTIPVVWLPFTFPVPFYESGLPPGTTWWVNASGSVLSGSGPSLVVPAANGSTPYRVGSGYAYLPDSPTGTIDVTSGSYVPVNVQFSVRMGHIAGSVDPGSAVLSLNGTNVPLVGGRFNESVAPGTYSLVASAPGYATQTLNVRATPGNTTTEQISLLATNGTNSTGVTPSSAGPSTLDWVLIGLGAVAAAAIAVAAVALSRRGRNS